MSSKSFLFRVNSLNPCWIAWLANHILHAIAMSSPTGLDLSGNTTEHISRNRINRKNGFSLQSPQRSKAFLAYSRIRRDFRTEL